MSVYESDYAYRQSLAPTPEQIATPIYCGDEWVMNHSGAWGVIYAVGPQNKIFVAGLHDRVQLPPDEATAGYAAFSIRAVGKMMHLLRPGELQAVPQTHAETVPITEPPALKLAA